MSPITVIWFVWKTYLTSRTYSRRKDVLIVDEGLDPVHQKVHVHKSRQFGGLLVLIPILPPVFITWSSGHDGTTLLRTELAHGPVDEVDTIEEIHHMHSYPVINVLPIGQLHHFPQVQAWFQRRLGSFVQLKALGSRFKSLSRPECFVFAENLTQAQSHCWTEQGDGVVRSNQDLEDCDFSLVWFPGPSSHLIGDFLESRKNI